MAANFNNSAWFYDRLASAVYGHAIVDAQVYLLQFIPAVASVLIVGGGTGWILDELTKLHPAGLTITYIEVAAGMMTRSKKRRTGGNEVVFIADAVENVPLNPDFDVIITPFLFDNFTGQTLKRVFVHVHSGLKDGGQWLNCDFRLTGKWWQNLLLSTMFFFFRLLCGIEASRLPAIEAEFNGHGYQVAGQQSFFSDFIISRVYFRKAN